MVTRFCIALLFLLSGFVFAQEYSYPKDVFIPPMDLPLELSGSFSELRSVNFHSGIDVRVINRPHRRVYAVGDGYISRIKVEPAGYGNALYITHPQGYVSVYAHLDFFSNEVAELIKKIQYQKQSFFIDVTFPADSLQVKKGEVIGIAGNTGYSFGAHLHFEMRDAVTEETIDPLLFGFKVADVSAPQFRELKIYSHGNSTINEKNYDIVYSTSRQSNGNYGIAVTPKASGAVSFGFEVLDKQNASNPNRLGLRTLKVWVDDSLLVHIEFDRLDFSVVRHQLAFIDFPHREKTKKRFQRTWKKPGNQLPFYKYIRDDGILYITENKHYRVKCYIEDIGGNTANLLFSINGTVHDSPDYGVQCAENQVEFRWDTITMWAGNYTQVIMDKGALFSNECVRIVETPHAQSVYAPGLNLISDEALSGFYNIRFSPSVTLDDINGMTVAMVNSKGELNGITTVFSDGWFEARTRSFGTFILVKDTTAPQSEASKVACKFQCVFSEKTFF
jgi:murein DD-endopeptidase MepM/ murein hydrolase activator NlpD